MTEEEKRRLRAIASGATQQYNAGNAATGTRPRKSWATDQISTVTGMGGGLIGALLGTAAGPVGTVGGGAAGSAAGSAFGEWLENKLTGEDDFKNVGREALLGGVFGAGPIRGANMAIQGGKALVKGTGRKGLQEALETAATATPIRSWIGRGGQNAQRLGGQMMGSQAQVTGAQARQARLRPTDTIASVNQRTGLSSLDDMAQVSAKLTGKGDDSILDVLTREAVGSTNGVDVGDLRTAATKLLDDQGTLLTKSQRQQVLDNVKNASVRMRGGSQGSLSSLAEPQAALDQANTFRAAAQTIKSRSLTASPEQAQQAKIYDALAKQIEDSIYKAPGVSDSVPQLARYGATSLREMAGESTNKAQAEAYRRLAKELEGVKSVADIRKMKRDFVGISKIDDLTAQAQGSRSFNADDAISVIRSRPVSGVVGAAIGSGVPRAGGALSAVGRRLAQVGGESVPTATSAAARTGAGLGLSSAINQEVEPQVDTAVLPPEELLGMDAIQQQPPQNPFGVSREEIGAAMMNALMAGDRGAYSQLGEMMELVEMFEGVQGAELSAAERAAQAKTENALGTVNTLEAALQAAGGPQGRIGGTISNLLGSVGLNDQVNAYNDVSRGSMAQIIRGLGESGSLSDGDVARGLSLLPKVTDTPGEVETKMAMLRQMLGQAAANPAGGAVAPVQQPVY